MSVTLLATDLPLTGTDVIKLWQATIDVCQHADDDVTVRSVTTSEIQELNRQYRHKDAVTNILTFTYPAIPDFPDTPVTHDISVCVEVAQAEAVQRGVAYRDYIALLLAHAFLHAAGMDHEKSAKAARETERAEKSILEQTGFEPLALR